MVIAVIVAMCLTQEGRRGCRGEESMDWNNGLVNIMSDTTVVRQTATTKNCSTFYFFSPEFLCFMLHFIVVDLPGGWSGDW